MGKTEKKLGPSRVSKTVTRAVGSKGGPGRWVLCPVHTRRMTPVILVPPAGRPRAGWRCGETAGPNPVLAADGHYLTRNLEEWNP